MIDPGLNAGLNADAVARSWWTGLTPKDRVRYRQRVRRSTDALLAPHAHALAAAGLPPPG